MSYRCLLDIPSSSLSSVTLVDLRKDLQGRCTCPPCFIKKRRPRGGKQLAPGHADWKWPCGIPALRPSPAGCKAQVCWNQRWALSFCLPPWKRPSRCPSETEPCALGRACILVPGQHSLPCSLCTSADACRRSSRFQRQGN